MAVFETHIPEDLTFPAGTTYVVIIDTDSYAGNFERQMTAYAAGAFDEDRYHGNNEFDEFDEDAENDPRLVAIQEKLITVTHRDYGEVSNTIWSTPGRVNNGMGVSSDAADDAIGFPSYESAAFFTDEPLTQEELDLVLKRASKYGDERVTWNNQLDPVKVLGIRQIEISVERKVTVGVRNV